ncbi:MAG TPA: HEAT repeat domain-containing protein [Kofleriaceae bacterium]|nr:HEAT repeat domain-containing protein [Kofleriaceae bacterium]
MKRVLVILALCTMPASGAETQLAPRIVHALTPIDSLPTKDEIIAVLPTNTLDELAKLARDPYEDFGVRLRAVRALPQFCTTSCAGTPPHQALVSLFASVPSEPPDRTSAGEKILLVRATIEALGATGSRDAADVTRLATYLDNPSRDIRAAAAFALRDLCNPSARPALRARYTIEVGSVGVPQVRLAISEALRGLDTCGN